MYPLTLLPLAEALIPDHAALKLALAIPGVIFLALLWSLAQARDERDDGPPTLPLSALETIWPFFKTRHDFLARGFQSAGSVFKFKLLRVRHTSVLSSLSADIRLIEYSRRGVGRTCQSRLLLVQGP